MVSLIPVTYVEKVPGQEPLYHGTKVQNITTRFVCLFQEQSIAEQTPTCISQESVQIKKTIVGEKECF